MRQTPLVLVVEDDTDLLSSYVQLLQGEGMEVMAASDGPSAMMMMKTGRRPDLVVLDLRLPHLGGREIAQEIRRDEALRAARVLVVSADGGEVPEADLVLTKPTRASDLLRSVYGLIHSGPVAGEQPG